MTSLYHGSKISVSQQTLLIETAISICERWNKKLFLSAITHRKVMSIFSFFFCLLYLEDHGLLRSRNFATMATCRNQFLLSLEIT